MFPWYPRNPRTVLRDDRANASQEQKHCSTAAQPLGGLEEHTHIHTHLFLFPMRTLHFDVIFEDVPDSITSTLIRMKEISPPVPHLSGKNSLI